MHLCIFAWHLKNIKFSGLRKKGLKNVQFFTIKNISKTTLKHELTVNDKVEIVPSNLVLEETVSFIYSI